MVLGVPLAQGRVPPNRWYGVRLRSTLADEATWYAVNERAGRELAVLGVVIVGLAVAVPMALPQWPAEFQQLALAGALVAGLMVITIRAVRHGTR